MFLLMFFDGKAVQMCLHNGLLEMYELNSERKNILNNIFVWPNTDCTTCKDVETGIHIF